MIPPRIANQFIKQQNQITLPWQYKVPSNDLWFSHFILIMGEVFMLYFVYIFFQKINFRIGISLVPDAMVSMFLTGLISLYMIYKYNYNLLMATSMQYFIFDDAIGFQWGTFRTKKVIIPFEEILSLNLVSWEDSNYSRIHFGVSTDYKILKWNFDKIDTNHHITFQRITNGEKIYNLINDLRIKHKKDKQLHN